MIGTSVIKELIHLYISSWSYLEPNRTKFDGAFSDSLNLQNFQFSFLELWTQRLYNFTDKLTSSILEKQDDATFQVSNLPFPLPFCDKGLATQIFVSDQLTFT